MQKNFDEMTLTERWAHMKPIWHREDTCRKLADQVLELNNRGLLPAGESIKVGEFSAHLSADRWDTTISHAGNVLMSRKPEVDYTGRVHYVNEELNGEANWLAQWNSAYKNTLAMRPMGVGYHVLNKFRKMMDSVSLLP